MGGSAWRGRAALPKLERVLERSMMVCLLGLFRTERLASEMSAVTRVMEILQDGGGHHRVGVGVGQQWGQTPPPPPPVYTATHLGDGTLLPPPFSHPMRRVDWSWSHRTAPRGRDAPRQWGPRGRAEGLPPMGLGVPSVVLGVPPWDQGSSTGSVVPYGIRGPPWD